MSEMVERVARTICESKLWHGAFEQEPPGNREHWRDMARAAIGAMREPTEKMKRPLLRLMDAYASGLIPKDEDLVQAWRIAIGEALSNGDCK